jgi:hypothetical protein
VSPLSGSLQNRSILKKSTTRNDIYEGQNQVSNYRSPGADSETFGQSPSVVDTSPVQMNSAAFGSDAKADDGNHNAMSMIFVCREII